MLFDDELTEDDKLRLQAADALESLSPPAGMVKDAERYRWLRSEEVCTVPRYYEFWNQFLESKLVREERMDDLIDKTMGELNERY